ncbi:MAG TPA: sugar ABC transporter substrate-binding protein [Plantibacter sp.]|uniref:ABC transporter substrate-binding protein n=1 Tax=unclassified Plantibacter TaxID=2624265 RepID=UPI002C7780F2|nr:sugar ABC transporter substrate-binding protein [Plantibacter sp.]
MPQRPRRVSLLTILAITATSLVGCSTPGAAEDGDVDLTMAIWSANEDHLALFDAIADDYLADHDEVDSITFETITNQDYIAGLTTRMAGGNVPDLAWIPEANAPEFIESGVLADLTDTFTDTEGYDVEDLLPSATALWEKGGDLYAYPFSNSPFALYVNRDILEAAGQPDVGALVGTDDYTWDTIADIAAAVTASTGDTGLVIPSFSPTTWDNLTPLWASWGASPWTEDAASCTFTDPEMTDFLSWFQAQTARGAVSAVTTAAQNPVFATGDVAFSVAQLSASGALDDTFGWDFLPLPAGPKGEQGVIGQAGIGVVAKSAHVDAATDFLAYFTNAANSEKLATYFPPSRESLLNVSTLSAAAPKLSEEQIQSAIIDVVPDAIVKSSSPVYSKVTSLVSSALDPVWSGGDVGDATAAVCAVAQPVLGR